MNLSGLHRKFVLNGRDTMDPTKVTGPTQLLSLGYLWQSVPGIDTDGTSTANANEGHQTWIYIKVNQVGGIQAGNVIERDDLSDDYVGQLQESALFTDSGMVAQNIIGVAQYDIADGEYGFILREGVTGILTVDAGGVSDAHPLITSRLTSGAAGDYTQPNAGALTNEMVNQMACIIGLTIKAAAPSIFRINCVG